MNRNAIQFKIDQLRQEKTVTSVESIAVLTFCLFAIAFLPRLLFTYFFANQQLLEEPPILTHMPAFFFAVGVIYFVFAQVLNIARRMKIMSLEKELEKSGLNNICCTDCDDCDCGDHGDCACGCDDMSSMTTSSTTGSTSAMAARMSAVSKKRKPAKKK
jgi:hypothetical protein